MSREKVQEIISNLTNIELYDAFSDIKAFRITGILDSKSIVRKIHNRVEEYYGKDFTLRGTEDLIMFEICERWING